MSLHLIIGAGPVGSATALRLAAVGQQVRIITRSGTGPDAEGIEKVAADAADPDRLSRLAAGTAVVYNCASPPYHRWPQDWPPLAASVLAAAEHAGAVLVTMSNLYGYGPVAHPITEQDPLAATGPEGQVRAAIWAQALAAHQAGRVRAAEARASDFFGPGFRGQSPIGERSIPRLLVGRPIAVLGDPDAPYSWTYLPDIAATLVTLGAGGRAWGRAWHVPTSAPMSQRARSAPRSPASPGHRAHPAAGTPMADPGRRPHKPVPAGVQGSRLPVQRPVRGGYLRLHQHLRRRAHPGRASTRRDLDLVGTPGQGRGPDKVKE